MQAETYKNKPGKCRLALMDMDMTVLGSPREKLQEDLYQYTKHDKQAGFFGIQFLIDLGKQVEDR